MRLEPVDQGVAGEDLTALAASPDGKTLYYVQSRQVYEVPADGSGPSRKLGPGDGVAAYPVTGELLIRRFEKAGIRLFRLPRPTGRLAEVPVKQGSLAFAVHAPPAATMSASPPADGPCLTPSHP